METREQSVLKAGLGLFRGRRGRHVKTSLTAYLFVLPAFLIIGLFGLFPIAFAFYVSLHRWRITPGKYLGLENYVTAMDALTYVGAFGLAIVLVILAVRAWLQVWRVAREHGDRPWVWLAPAVVAAAGLGKLVHFGVLLLPEVLAIPDKAKGQKRTQELFVRLLGEAWRTPAVQSALRTALLILLVGLALAYVVHRFMTRSPRDGSYNTSLTWAFLLVLGAFLLGRLTYTQIQAAYQAALEQGEPLELWVQVVTIGAGFGLLWLSWWLWQAARRRDSSAATLFHLAAAAILAVGAWALIGELPRVVSAGDKDWWEGLKVTVYYSVGTVPFQLGISLLLAVLLFQNIRGKALFRLIYFLPYITPTVAAAAVFRVFFSSGPTTPMNSLLKLLGAKPLLWLDEPRGVFQMIAGSGVDLPAWAEGPSLALVVIIIYNVWSYVGYDTVIFLAGLGSIPSELYEAAAIDGAGRWSQFRHVTLPLLSPTTYFLTLLAVIGTFKAFNHVWVLRSGAALGTTDAASIVIFNEFNRNTRYGYAAALALVLLGVILILTIANNRIAEKRVFYG
jgi:multiple sugar transport system permease protein